MTKQCTILAMSLIFCSSLHTNAQDMPQAFEIYNYKGKVVSYKNLINDAKKADIVFFGELHNNPIAHWMQLEITRDLYAQKPDQVVLGAEMFEADNQLLMDEYLAGLISQRSFEQEARLWDNYSTDYKPLVEFAKENEIPFIATNIPRRYASVVYKRGIDALNKLPKGSKQHIAPLPIETDLDVGCYQKMLEMGGGNEKFPHAQMIKDATMAHFILENHTKGNTFLHYNGAFHSDYKEGIIWYLRSKKPKLKIVVISTVEQSTITELEEEHLQKADYIFCVPDRMTKTY
ncbi:MAG: ChaN family lipoprotein [Saprospiraceae bacterium]|nr:ChaN family lipoprotein [Saprospiraceae bacterium]